MTCLCLSPRWALRVHNRRAYVERRQDRVRVAALSALEAVALGLMNGRRTGDVIQELMFEIGGQAGNSAFEQLHKRLKPLLVPGSFVSKTESLDQLASVEPPDPAEGLRPLPGPRALHWWVTDVCPRRCVYCFADPKPGNKAHDATLSRETLRRIFAESASLGATDLLVAGGEPFLRDDLPEVLGDAINQGLNPGITTKFPLTATLAHRLANAGLRHICLSIDSFSPDDNALLIGSRNYAAHVLSSVENLVEAGLAFSFECVVTRLNTHALESVIAKAEQLGAQVVQVVPYEPVLHLIGPYQNEFLMLPREYPLDENIRRFSAKYPGVEIEKFEKLGDGCRGDFHCDIGMTKLLFTSRGKVHRCYKLLEDQELAGSDLNHVSVAEAWHDPGFTEVVRPPHVAYSDSPCITCTNFDNCHESGRCIYQSYVDHQTYYSTDRNCGRSYVLPTGTVNLS